MDSLADHMNLRDVRDALETLPAEVNATYDIALERITQQNKSDRKVAEQVLSWITHACRPLSLEEIRHALAVSPGNTIMDPNALGHELMLTSVCAGLVVEYGGILRLVRE